MGKTVIVRYQANGRSCTTSREVHFHRDHGHYIRWNKRVVVVDPARLVVEMMDLSMDVKTLTEDCHRFITHCGDRRGVSQRDLAKYVASYREAGLADRDRVHDALSNTAGIAYLNRTEGWRFWPRAMAPEEATRA